MGAPCPSIYNDRLRRPRLVGDISGFLPQFFRVACFSSDEMCQGLNSHDFHIIGDKLINPIVGVYTHYKDSY